MKTHTIQSATNSDEIREMVVRAGLDEEVCQWCDLRGEVVCWLECMPDKRFKFLKPRWVLPWERVRPPLDFLDWVYENPKKIRALIYLMVYYLSERAWDAETELAVLSVRACNASG